MKDLLYNSNQLSSTGKEAFHKKGLQVYQKSLKSGN